MAQISNIIGNAYNSFEPVSGIEWRNNSASYFVEAFSDNSIVNPSDIVIAGEGATYAGRRIGVSAVILPQVIHRINPNNQNVTFAHNSIIYTVAVPTGFYNLDPLAVDGYLTVLLGLMSAISGATFSAVVVQYSANLYFTISVNAGTWRFVEDESLRRLRWWFGPNLDLTESVSKVVGPVYHKATTFIDVRSNVLTENQKMSNNSNTKTTTSSIVRLYPANPLNPDYVVGKDEFIFIQRPKWSNLDPSRSIHDVDIRLVDEWGDILPVLEPVASVSAPNPNGYGFRYTIILSIEPNS